MAHTITIPIDAHLITLVTTAARIVTREIQVGRGTQTQREQVTETREHPPGRDEANVRRAIDAASGVWRVADINFTLRSIETNARAEAPNNMEAVDPNGYHFLAGRFPSVNNGISLLLVGRVTRENLGGEAVETSRVCLLPALNDFNTDQVLAHEFGHLLGLRHYEIDGTNADMYNLMYPLSRAGNRLRHDQIQRARRSQLARLHGGR